MWKSLTNSKYRLKLATRFEQLCKSVDVDPESDAVLNLFKIFLKHIKRIEASSCGCECCAEIRKANRIKKAV